MTALELLQEIRSRGGDVSLDGENLRLSARTGILTEELRNQIAANKADIIAALRDEEAEDPVVLPKDGAMPLSHFQERVWIIQSLDAGATEYNLVTAWRWTDGTDTQALERAARSVVARHVILRSVFLETPTGPEAKTLEPDAVPVLHTDITDMSEAEKGAALNEMVNRETSQPFDLQKRPPCRFMAVDVDAETSVLLVAVHHIATDQWSMALLKSEVDAALADPDGYAARSPALEYADYAAWQRRRLGPARLDSHLTWWEQKLSGHPELCALNADLVPELEWAGTTLDFEWDAELSGELTRFAKQSDVSLYMCLVAAAAIALHRHTGLEDIVLGSPVAMRERAEFERIIGPFVNTQVLRMPVTPGMTFAEVLREARGALLDAYPHAHVPFEMVVDKLKPPRSLNRTPVFQFAVVLHNASDGESAPIFGGGAVHEMTWFVRESGGRIMGSIEYRTDIYLEETVRRLLDRLQLILGHAIRNPDTAVDDIPLVSDREHAILTEEFVPPAVEIDPAPYPHQVSRVAAETPEAVAIHQDGVSITYGDLEAMTNRVARHLAGKGIGTGNVVGICLGRTPDLIAAMIAVQKCGAAYVPLDPDFPEDRLAYILANSGAVAVLTDGKAARRLDPGPEVENLPFADLKEEASAQPATLPEVAISPDDTSHLIYTSGSTGRPKGVEISHGALSNLLGSLRQEPGMTADDIVAATTTVSFDIAAVELQLPLTVGARIELLSREIATDGDALGEALTACGATVSQATPSAWRMLMETDWQGSPAMRAISGGEPLTRDLADALLARVGKLWNGYGPSETTIYSTGCWIRKGTEAISIGRPVANTTVYVLDAAGKLAPIGMQGEICIGGAGVAKGYVGLPEQTAASFVPDPFDPAARIYKTGDLGRWTPDGRLIHLGRGDRQVKLRGVRIELGEIEEALLSSPQIRQAAVMVHDAGHGDQKLAGYVVFEPGEEMTTSEVRRHLRATLPGYMIPPVFVDLPSLPQTPNGKVDRKALPQPFGAAMSGGDDHVPPAPGLESSLAAIWREVLQIDTVGADDNFFELGGHSLLTLRVTKRVRVELGVALDPRLMFFKSLKQVALEMSKQLP